MDAFVTGAAGFIGSHLVDRLLEQGHAVTAYDNFSTGRREFLAQAYSYPNFRLVEGDLLDPDALSRAMGGADVVFHMAANADVRYGLEHPRKDLEQNTIATFNVLEAMRQSPVKTIAFASTGSIYGDATTFPTPENAPFPIQTSLYGASKLACEGLIAAYAEGFAIRALIFRFVSILGERYTHGHVFDFVRRLSDDPTQLRILGDGRQRKSYLYVRDCVDAMLIALERVGDRVNVLNLGTNEYCEIRDSARWISDRLGVTPEFNYAGGERGWVGDSPFIFLETERIRALGWRPQLAIRPAVERTVDWLRANEWILSRRGNQ